MNPTEILSTAKRVIESMGVTVRTGLARQSFEDIKHPGAKLEFQVRDIDAYLEIRNALNTNGLWIAKFIPKNMAGGIWYTIYVVEKR